MIALSDDEDYAFSYRLYEIDAVTNTNNKKSRLAAADLNNLRALQPGTMVDLQISTPTSPKRVKTVYVGLDYPRCMIFQFPNLKKFGVLKDLLYPENTVIIRYVLEGTSGQVIAFKAKINHIQSQPSPLFFTTFPSTLQSLGLRSEKRAFPGIAADFTFAGDNRGYKSLIVDVSQSGCRLAIEEQVIDSLDIDRIEPETEVAVCVDLSEKTLLLDGQIKNQKNEDGYVFIGIQFQTTSSDIDVLLKRHIINI